MYATVYACIRRNTSKILPSCYCLKPVVKLTLSIWNDTIKLNILQGRLHKFYSDTRSEFYTLYRVCGSTDKDTKRVKWTLGVSFFCLAKCFDMYQIQSLQKEERSFYAT